MAHSLFFSFCRTMICPSCTEGWTTDLKSSAQMCFLLFSRLYRGTVCKSKPTRKFAILLNMWEIKRLKYSTLELLHSSQKHSVHPESLSLIVMLCPEPASGKRRPHSSSIWLSSGVRLWGWKLWRGFTQLHSVFRFGWGSGFSEFESVGATLQQTGRPVR